jgi:hypothetical protein
VSAAVGLFVMLTLATPTHAADHACATVRQLPRAKVPANVEFKLMAPSVE